MKRLRKSIRLFLISMLIMGSTGCSNIKKTHSEVKNQSASSHYPITITTYNHSKEPIEITFNKEPERVVSIYQNSIETLLALGLEDKIVLGAGLDHSIKDEYKDKFKKIKYINNYVPDVEDILNENPDFILSWYSIFHEDRIGNVNYWKEKGINTYMSLNSGITEKRTVENEITDIINLGKIFNVEEKAEKIVREINNEIEDILNDIKHTKEETTLIIEYMGEDIYTYGKETLGGDMVTRLGGKLLEAKNNTITEEELIELNPDSIFVVYMDRMDTNVPSQEANKILKSNKLKDLDAVRNNRVNTIALGEMYCSGIRTIDGIKTFAKGLYPKINS